MSARRVVRFPPARRLVRGAALAAVVALAGLAVAAVVSGAYQIRPVLSGSMRPGLAVGGVVITQRVPVASLRARDVVLFHRPDHPNELVVHRIIKISPSNAGPVVTTQGDADSTADPWTITLHGTTTYRARFSLPLAGYAAIWAHEPPTRRVALLLATLVAATAFVLQFRHRKRRADPGEPDAADPSDEQPVSTPVDVLRNGMTRENS